MLKANKRGQNARVCFLLYMITHFINYFLYFEVKATSKLNTSKVQIRSEKAGFCKKVMSLGYFSYIGTVAKRLLNEIKKGTSIRARTQ